MNITTGQLEKILRLSRSQVCRHFQRGRLRKIRVGVWDAASAARVQFPVLRFSLTYCRPEVCEREMTAVIAAFRRDLRRVVNDPARGDEIEEAVKEYARELGVLTEAFRRQSQ